MRRKGTAFLHFYYNSLLKIFITILIKQFLKEKNMVCVIQVLAGCLEYAVSFK